MTSLASPGADAWLALGLLAIDPALLGGVALRAGAGPVRDRWLDDFRAALSNESPWRRVPVHAGADRLLGGLDLAATLQLGRSVAQRGLLAEGDGGVLVLAMAERLGVQTLAHFAAALDNGEVRLARDGIEQRLPARFGVVALDEGADADERPAEGLLDRLALHLDLSALSLRDVEAARSAGTATPACIAAARRRLPSVRLPDELLEAICAAAVALGVMSLRACVMAARVARAAAALGGRDEATAEDAGIAARLVLAPRATRLPAPVDANRSDIDDAEGETDDPPAETDASADADTPDTPDPPPNDADAATDEDADDKADDPGANPGADERVLAAAAAAIPPGLLARLQAGSVLARQRPAGGRVGAQQASARQGRPAGLRRGVPRGGARLDLIATLRAAAPWQRLRERAAGAEASEGTMRVRVRAEDFHVARRIQRGRTTTIFAVDASGSSALQRLAEAKGAVELLLAECYVRRDSVAVIAFRGRGSQLLLPPTRSLVRAKRSLAELPGGGGTPLAEGLDAALALALAVRTRGDTPVVVVLTDGRANVARGGAGGRVQAELDALAAARAFRLAQVGALLIDTSPQPQPRAREIALTMQATYLPLPYAGAATLSQAVQAVSQGGPAALAVLSTRP